MNETTEQLIRGCRAGERSAQLAMYERYARRVYLACLRIIGNAEEAEEAMQDVFMKLFTRMEQFHDELNFEVWMHRIAVNVAIDYVRRHQPEMEELPGNLPETEETEAVDEEAVQYTVEQVKAAMQKLPAGYRVVLSLYLFEGYDMEEIASILHILPASVRSQYLRAKRKLVELITKKQHG